MNYEKIADGTENFVDKLFENDNMELIMQKMIKESNRQKEVGYLPSTRLTEKEIDDLKSGKLPRAAKDIVALYKHEDNRQKKDVYITNLAVSKTNGQNHYCSFWINKKKKFVNIWDSASSGYRASNFYSLFEQAAKSILKKNLEWVDKLVKVLSTPDEQSFQHGGGFFGKPKSLLAQNIYCHTWTLFFLELHLFGYSFRQISCFRGNHPLLPLAVIKLYSQCILKRLNVKMTSKYEGLMYIWDEKDSKAIPLPKMKKGSKCAVSAVENAKKASLLVPVRQCKNILYL